MPRTVLVVDDSESIRQMVTFTLKEAGFSVLEGGDGRDALSKVADQRVDLVITDLNMPIMDGIALVKELRRHPLNKFTPILLLTTETQEEKKKQAKSAGATGWIVKPFHPGKLLQVISKVLP